MTQHEQYSEWGVVQFRDKQKINVKECQGRRSKDIRRQKIKNIKPLDGRMIIENGVIKKEGWAGRLRQERSWVEVEWRRERQRRLHLSAKTSPINSTSQHTSESCLLDWTDGAWGSVRVCAHYHWTKTVCVCVCRLLLYCMCMWICMCVYSYACLCSCVVVALRHLIHRNLLEMQDVPRPTEHTHARIDINTVGAISRD